MQRGRHRARYRGLCQGGLGRHPDKGIPVIETVVPHEMLYLADEVFSARPQPIIESCRQIFGASTERGLIGTEWLSPVFAAAAVK